jgi:glycosyltransferase involved in cell wall biosynthesis
VGISLLAACGVRDHATLLAQGLEAEGVSCEMHWLQRESPSLRSSATQVRRFAAGLVEQLNEDPPDAVIVHYSVFAYAHKGLPLYVRPVFAALRRAGVPVIAVLHEFAYPWGYGGWRGVVWAITQRASMVGVMRTAGAVIVTADWRQRWLATRRWLRHRPTTFVPVFSNLPPATAGAQAPQAGRIGLFGYAYQGASVELIADALATLRARGVGFALRLLGAPGRDSAAGEEWLAQARARGIEDVLSFTGRLPAQELADALAGCEVLLFADAAGPSPRKGTLAGSLASGRPVVALDGPLTWPALVNDGAIRLAAPTPPALADALQSLIGDSSASAELGARGRAFYDREMAAGRTVAAVLDLLAEEPRHADSAAR